MPDPSDRLLTWTWLVLTATWVGLALTGALALSAGLLYSGDACAEASTCHPLLVPLALGAGFLLALGVATCGGILVKRRRLTARLSAWHPVVVLAATTEMCVLTLVLGSLAMGNAELF